MKEYLRPHLFSFKAYSPGLTIEEVKDRYNLGRVIKLASNENPLGVSPLVKDVLDKYRDYVFRYPYAGNEPLRQELARFLNVPKSNIVIGNGSDEIIDLVLQLLVDPAKDVVLGFRPCFSIYKTQSRLHQITLVQVDLGPDFNMDLQKLAGKVTAQTRLIFLTNPDNPSGFALPKQELKSFIQDLPKGVFVLLDEAYIDFADPEEDYSFVHEFENFPQVIFLRTFSKLFGLAGIRLGYAVVNEDLADYFWRIRLPFSVNILAEKAGIAALRDVFFREKTRKVVLEGRNFLSQELPKLGCQVFPSQANFLLVKPPLSPKLIFENLLQKGIIIRTLDSYGLPEYFRISIGTMEENRLFLERLGDILR